MIFYRTSDKNAITFSNMGSFIEVCSGCGGLSTGFMNAGFKPILLNEIEKTFCDTLKENHPGVNIVQKSMTEINLTEFKNKIDVLAGGVPCQAFSHAGERQGLDDPRGHLIIEFNRLVLECEPKLFLIENVKGLLTHNNGKTFHDVTDLLKNNGKYNIHHKLLNAKDYDVPQKRERVFIIGIRSDITGEWSFPPKSAQTVLLRDVLKDVPPSPGVKYTAAKEAVMRLVPPGGCWVDLPKDVQREYMGEKSLAAGGGKRGMARRLSMDEHSLTLTTSPNQKQTERCHPVETRPLNVREYARIQTFPDKYIFKGGISAQYKQIGNAVPVKLAQAIAQQISQFLKAS